MYKSKLIVNLRMILVPYKTSLNSDYQFIETKETRQQRDVNNYYCCQNS